MIVFGRVLLCLACTTVAATALVAQQPTPAKPAAPAAAPAQKAPVFVVVHEGDRFEVLKKEDVAARQKKLADEHAKAMQQFEKDKKAAEAAKLPFDRQPPKPVTLVTLPGEYASQADAEAAMKKAKADRDKAEKPKAEKPKDKDTPQPPKK